MINNTRRKVLKGLAYGAVLSATAFSPLALSNNPKTLKDTAVIDNKISILRKTIAGKEQVTLVNNINQRISLNAEQPVTIQYVNGLLSVNANTDIKGDLILEAKESLSFEIDAYNVEQIYSSLGFDTASNEQQFLGHLNITSEHHAFNRSVAVTSLTALTAA